MSTPTLDLVQAPQTILEFERRFRTEDDCREYIETLRWPEGFACQCGARQAWRTMRKQWKCRACSRTTSATAGTIFHGSHLPLTAWFRAIWLVTSQRTGISALELQHSLGLGSYRTAWAMLHDIRKTMLHRRRPLQGRIDVGIRCFCSTKRCVESTRKSYVAVAVEESHDGIGRVRMRCLQEENHQELHKFLHSVVSLGSVLCPDDARTADVLAASQFPSGQISSLQKSGSRVQLTISMVKRWLNGTHQGRYEHKYLELYLEEFSFRFNRRNVDHPGSLFIHLLTSAVREMPKVS